jgi:RHS repeat-associated protein
VVTPDGVTLGPGEERQFSAEVTGLGDPSVTWSASAGSIDSKSGAFTAPAVTSGVIVTATSVQEPSQSGRAVVVVAEAVGQDFTYDAAGQLLSDGARSFEWDAEGRLTAVTAGTRRTEFAYDAWDRPFLASVRDNGVITSRRRLLWLDDRLIEERSLPASGPETPVARYFFGGAQMDGAARFYVYDHRSGLRQLVDQAGQVVGRYDYDPFGQVTNREGPPPPFGFAGYREDPTTGLALTPARAYDATLGRWLSRDPIEEEGGLNLYAYALNDPVNLRDPSGLSPHDRQPTRQPQEPLCTAENPYGCPPGYVCDGRGAPRPCPVGHWCLNGRPTKIPSGPDIRRPPSAPHAADFGPQRPRPVGPPGRFYLITATNPEDVRTNPDWGSDLDPDDRKWIRLGVHAWSFLASFAAGANQRRGMGTPGPGSGSSSYGVGGTTLTPVPWPPGAGRP